MKFISTQKYLITSPRKLREVVFMIKKLSPSEALNKISFTFKRAAFPLAKVIKSAIANAKQKGVDISDLAFESIQINDGPKLKRWRAGARGRAKPYKRRMSHIKVVLVQRPKSQNMDLKVNDKKVLKSEKKIQRIKQRK
ncbi:MAG: 50S ribosomal protein L22 [Patescibacteria group bacterium]|nr:50S ribosomal protein L22 [Patescibacteria group bacterium]MCX7928554.1 50S ribosomal protein L22 [Patescibacteria group bacterium]